MGRVNPFFLAGGAILLWSTLALAGSSLQNVPRFLLLAVTLVTGGSIAIFRRRGWRIPLCTLLVGVGGIFGYHFLYFTAFAHAPAVETNLINYFWPILIVLLSPLILPGTRLHLNHVFGAFFSIIGAGLIATDGKLSLQVLYLAGYSAAFGAALTWAVYSLMTKRLPPFPTESIGVFCLVSGLLSLGLFALQGNLAKNLASVAPMDWFYLVLVGIGPMGAAFYCWDAALKGGDTRIIGALAYLTPLLSTLNLIIFAGKRLTVVTFIAMCLIIAGALVGSTGLFKRSGRQASSNQQNPVI